jgi:hypothetical protein
VGALLAGAALLGGCINADKPVNRFQPATQKQAATANGQQSANVGNGAAASQNGGQSGTQTGSNNGQLNQFRTNNSPGVGQQNGDPNQRIGLTTGTLTNGNTGVATDSRFGNNVQPASGFAAGQNSNVRPIATSLNNNSTPAGPQPIVPLNAAPLDPTPARNSPAPVSMQSGDRDLNNGTSSGMPAFK